MNDRELADQISRQVHVPAKGVRRMLASLAETIMEALSEGDRVVISRLGSFRLQNGGPPSEATVAFKPSRRMETTVRREYARWQKDGDPYANVEQMELEL